MNELMMDMSNDKWGIKQLQNCILNIAQYIDSFCLENGIDYYLMGGSALGAVRHKGFIPWDDDLDIFMTIDNYERFRKAFQDIGDKNNYYLQEQGVSKGKITSAKLRYNNSTLIEESVSDFDIHHGVFVDIIILHNCPKRKISRYWQYLWCRYIVVKGLANKKNIRGGIVRKSILYLFRLCPRRFLLDFSLNQLYRYRNNKSDEYCHFLGRADIRRGIYKKEQFGKPIRFPFEKTILNVPCKVDQYLTDRFGDYMKIPSEEEIRYYQHAANWSVDEPFIPRKKGNYSDEKYLF